MVDRLAIRSTFFLQKAYPIRNMYRSGATLLVLVKPGQAPLARTWSTVV
jgi:hypothetical protein